MGLKTCQYKSQSVIPVISSLYYKFFQKQIYIFLTGWDSIVSIANCYRLDGLVIESQWR
jgi:hypothetical protein